MATLSLDDVALFRLFPALRGRVPWQRIGHWPTPIEPLAGLPGARAAIYVKREDRSHPRYGGNKVRTLEAALGRAVATGAQRVWATGAFGSNHATATVIHSPSVGLQPGIALYPQPSTPTARANLLAMLAHRPLTRPMRSVVELPFVTAWLGRRHSDFVMNPGAASPRGAVGALSAALELAEQVAAGQCPAPKCIVLATGSTCTTAGLLAGVHLAAQLGIGFGRGPGRVIPHIVGVRVTPWPITSHPRIVRLAHRTARHVFGLIGRPPPPFRQLYTSLTMDTRFFGDGYGRATAAGHRAARLFRDAGGPPLDPVYSAKSGAALLDLAADESAGPVLYWATKSSAPLPVADATDLVRTPPIMRTWLDGPVTR